LKPLLQGTTETDQFLKICGIVGAPGPANWLDGVKSPTRLGIRMPQTALVPLATVVSGASPGALDLLKQKTKCSTGFAVSLVPGKSTPSSEAPLETPAESESRLDVLRPLPACVRSSDDEPTFDDIFDQIHSINMTVWTDKKDFLVPVWVSKVPSTGLRGD
jgi:hypothetical protein